MCRPPTPVASIAAVVLVVSAEKVPPKIPFRADADAADVPDCRACARNCESAGVGDCECEDVEVSVFVSLCLRVIFFSCVPLCGCSFLCVCVFLFVCVCLDAHLFVCECLSLCLSVSLCLIMRA